MYKLCAVLLESDHVFLYITEKQAEEEMLAECVDFCEHKPAAVLEQIHIDHPTLQTPLVDTHVKRYMQSYGIDNVRGGSYLTLTPEIYEDLVKEFTKPTSAELLAQIKYIVVGEERWIIDRTVIDDIQWFKYTIQMLFLIEQYRVTLGNPAIEYTLGEIVREKYRKLLVYFKHVYRSAVFAQEDLRQSYLPFLDNPESVFDDIIYNTNITGETFEAAINLCDYLKHLVYCVVNRCDELEFDVENP
jgi:hypothetical protein